MADPNKPAVGGDAGTLTAPDFSQLQSDIASTEAQYEPRIEQEERTAESYERQSVEQQQTVVEEAESAAREQTAGEQEMQHWVDHTPTRQAAYATSMHAAPFLAILTAIGGKMTRLNGQQMLAATNGIVTGLNNASEEQYDAAYKAWQESYKRMADHQAALMSAHRLMLTAYQGRADAYQKAAEAARRMTGDILDDKQRQVSQKIDSFKAQAAAWDKTQRVNLAIESLDIRNRREIAQEKHWKEIEQKSANLPPMLKAQLAQEKQRWQNVKSQLDENLKRRGQINSNLTMSEGERQASLQSIDSEDQALTMEMNRAQSNADAILSGAIAGTGVSTPPGPDQPTAAAPTPGAPQKPFAGGGGVSRGHGAGGTWEEANPPSEAKIAAMQKHPVGAAVTFGDGTSWVRDADNSIHRVQ